MLHPRIIPCLLVKNKGLVKTRQFKDPKYVGDPINAVKIFNEKEVDELIVLDIDATAEGREPDYKMIGNLAAECRMPLCYGGGIKNLEQASRIFQLGVEKVAMSSAAVAHPDLLALMAEQFGCQSVAVVIDVAFDPARGCHEVWTGNGRTNTGKDPVAFSREMERLGAGEIIVNSIDRDGMMNGYDHAVVRMVRDSVSTQMTILGGAGSLSDIRGLFGEFGVIGAAAGSLFVFKGPYRAVLINYPSRSDKESCFNARA